MYNTDHYKSRHFNSVFDEDGLVVKSSKDVNKLYAEYMFYYYLPASIQRWFIQPFDMQVKEDVVQYKMEKIYVKNSAEILVNGEIDIVSFKKLLSLIDKFKIECKAIYYDEEGCRKESEYLVLNKTRSRIKGSHQDLYNRIELAYNKYKDERLIWKRTLSHGDLCLSNILYVKEFNFIKFIDPRGAILQEDIYLDEYYDLAKLSHSILGGYENILYEKRYKDSAIQQEFIKYLNVNNISVNLLRVYEASLFLSMVPLHSESPERCRQLISQCDKILSEVGF